MGSSRCSSTRRRPISSGRSGSASGASAAHVSGGLRLGSGRASGSNSPVAWSYIRSTIAGVSEGGRAPCSDRQCRTLVSHLAAHRAAGARRSAQVVAEPAVAPHEQDEPEPVVGAAAPDRRRTEARRRGPTRRAARSRSARRRRGRGGRPASRGGRRSRGRLAGSPTAIRHAHASTGGWMLGGHRPRPARSRCRCTGAGP